LTLFHAVDSNRNMLRSIIGFVCSVTKQLDRSYTERTLVKNATQLFPGNNNTDLKPGVYRHYKTGDPYCVLGCVLHTETNEILVLYRALRTSERNPLNMAFVRPRSMFTEHVVHNGQRVPRFQHEKPFQAIK
jgi:hypothetical protein